MANDNNANSAKGDGSGKIQVQFLHPRDSRQFKAEIGPTTTGSQAITALVHNRFVQAPGGNLRYALAHQRTGKTLPLMASLMASGVQNGDQVALTEINSGAGGC